MERQQTEADGNLPLPNAATFVSPAGITVAAVGTLGFAVPNHRRRLRYWWHYLVRHPSLAYGLCVVGVLFFLALFANTIAPYDPHAIHPLEALSGMSLQYLLGTDSAGRDLLSELMVGARTALSVSCIAVGIALTIAVPLGMAAGYFGSWLESLVMRIADAMLSLPSLLLALVLVAMLGGGLLPVSAGIATALIPLYVRLARASARKVRSQDYVSAALAVGATDLRIVRTCIVPNAMTPIICQAAMDIGFAIQLEAALSFLGFGLGNNVVSWGALLHDSFKLVGRAPGILVLVCLVLAVATSGFIMAGEGLGRLFTRSQAGVAL